MSHDAPTLGSPRQSILEIFLPSDAILARGPADVYLQPRA